MKNFLGIPIEGDIYETDHRVPQKPLSELEPVIRAVLDDPTIKAFGWTQYTPYFNDGDPCVFGVGEPWYVTAEDVAEGSDETDDEDRHTVDYNETLGKRPYKYGYDGEGRWTRIHTGDYEGPNEARYDRCLALSQAIESGAFNDVLLEAFGDHAEVTIRATGITVDTYHHD